MAVWLGERPDHILDEEQFWFVLARQLPSAGPFNRVYLLHLRAASHSKFHILRYEALINKKDIRGRVVYSSSSTRVLVYSAKT